MLGRLADLADSTPWSSLLPSGREWVLEFCVEGMLWVYVYACVPRCPDLTPVYLWTFCQAYLHGWGGVRDHIFTNWLYSGPNAKYPLVGVPLHLSLCKEAG